MRKSLYLYSIAAYIASAHTAVQASQLAKTEEPTQAMSCKSRKAASELEKRMISDAKQHLFSSGNLTEQRLQEYLKQGADINAQEGDGSTALMYAVFYNDLNNVNVLIAAKADLNKQDNGLRTALMLTVALGLSESYSKERLYVMKALVKAGADLNIMDEKGRFFETILESARYRHLKISEDPDIKKAIESANDSLKLSSRGREILVLKHIARFHNKAYLCSLFPERVEASIKYIKALLNEDTSKPLDPLLPKGSAPQKAPKEKQE